MALELIDYQLLLQRQPLFQTLNLTVNDGEVCALTGPSGSGKSTLLSDISGLLAPAFQRRGSIRLNNRELSDLPIERRHVGILFQEDLLFPHLNVYENLVMGLPRTLHSAAKQKAVSKALTEAGLDQYQQRDIATLSGGQRARISLLRTLLSEPQLILLDEPFAKLDKQLRLQFRSWVFEHINERNIPSVLVTHDEDDIPPGSQVIHLEGQHA